MQVSNLQDTHQACGMIKLDMQLVPNVRKRTNDVPYLVLSLTIRYTCNLLTGCSSDHFDSVYTNAVF